MNPRIGLQLYSVKEAFEKDPAGTFRRIKEIGYDGIELIRIFEYGVENLRTLCAENGLEPSSAHVSFEELCADPRKVAEACKTLGCRHVVIPVLPDAYKPGIGDFGYALKQIPPLGKTLAEEGLVLQFHNHFFEFERINGQYALDLLYESVSPALLQTQLDTCWINVSGEDPVAYLKKYAGRCPTVHLRDFVGHKKQIPFAATYAPERRADWDRPFQDRPLGKGLMQMEATTRAALAAGARWLIVENGPCGEDYSCLQAAEISLNYIKECLQ